MPELEAFYEDYVDKVYKFFYVNCLDRHLAEDLTSKTFLAFIDKAGNQGIDDHKKYLYGIMRNVWTTYLRDKYAQRVQQLEAVDDFEVYSNSIIDDYQSKSLKERAQPFIDKLPKMQKRIAQMRMIEELTLKEIAEELGKTMSYVKTTQNRALNNIRRLMAEPGETSS